MTPPQRLKAQTNGSRRVDLDAIRRARAEKALPPPTVRFAGREWTLAPGPPASVLIGVGELQEGQLSGLRDVIGGIFGPDNIDAILAAGFDVEDLEPVLGAYGLDVGESSASPGSP